MRLGKYLRVAFRNRWNLLVFLGSLAFALISGQADVAVPLVLAGEVAYLGLLGTHPKFQRYVDAQEAKAAREGLQAAVNPEETVRRILGALPKASVERFEHLRSQCAELRQLALEMRDPNRLGAPPPLEEMQLQGLDRLLWIYLRLLFTHHSLAQFLERTDEKRIQQDIDNLTRRLEGLAKDGGNVQQQRLRKALEDNLETSQTRLANFQKARDNHELVQVELDSLENKIRTLSELAINRQEPEFISGRVDQVVASMVQTEETMGELQFVTGLEMRDEAVPEMLPREATPVTQ
ncbi:MAG: hypothetical protein JXQ73_17715 [Phycisphaerae bacterium]|nr:hypothetical protein [Phycisphaerae bacterium]